MLNAKHIKALVSKIFRRIVCVLIFTGILHTTAGAVAVFEGGLGTPEDPYRISTVNQLQAMSADLNAHYILINDIDASETATWNWTVNKKLGNRFAGFEPIGDIRWADRFRGSLDGRGFKIFNLYINRPDLDRVGLFGYVEAGAGVRDLGLVDATVTGDQRTGLLAGENHGELSRVYSTGLVIGAWATGGLLGENASAGLISNAYSHAEVRITGYGGGLVGANLGTIIYSYSSGEVIGAEWAAGGLLGQMNGGVVANSYWDIESSGLGVSAAGTGLTTAELFDLDTFDNFDMADLPEYSGETWIIDDASGYPVFGWEYSSRPAAAVSVWPSAASLVYGQELSESSLSGGEANVAGRFSYADPESMPFPQSEASSFDVVFYPDDGLHYKAVTGQVLVTVSPRPVTLTGSFTVANKIYDGTRLAVIAKNNLALENILSGDEVALMPVAVFDSEEPGTHAVQLTSASTLSGAQAAAYVLSLEAAPESSGLITSLVISGKIMPSVSPASVRFAPEASPRRYLLSLEWEDSVAAPDSHYILESCTDVKRADWREVAVIPRQGGTIQYTHESDLQQTLYFRVKIPPATPSAP